MMVIALTLLLISLGFVLYRDRDFWFPDAEVAQDQPQQTAPAAAPVQQASTAATLSPAPKRRRPVLKTQAEISAPTDTAVVADPTTPPVTTTTERTVLPSLEVEVVAGDVHSTVRPGSNEVQVDLQPRLPSTASDVVSTSEASPSTADDSIPGADETAAALTSNASERVEMSADTSEIVSRPVSPGYPLLARQMKVQGSVILQALIGRDGLIQDLRVLSGPPILANAAEEAVKQWHFKPHYLGADAVETQAKITVNFTISTN